ncbi:MAG: FAD:protein FMN transferase, partial [Bacteroidota bacterium]|nr:FAD:protein FMN transferase [Bacteroidota bacterium]MDX5430522.1 FAD:protein FMN transferase [Bacteroidota bacterium]MDX5469275.1 FAD:protein FMN transferase [Bacteroidota bacterium]
MKRIAFIALSALVFGACSNQDDSQKLNQYATAAFGSNLDISYVGKPIDGLDFAVQTFITDFNQSLSTYDSTSRISRINNNQETAIDSLNFKVLQQALWWSKYSGGAFDVSVGPLVELWGFGKTGPKDVDSSEVEAARQLCGYTSFSVREFNLYKSKPEVRIDYNAIAPGFAADLLGEMLEKRGCSNYYVNVGGEIRCSGVNQDSAVWLIG